MDKTVYTDRVVLAPTPKTSSECFLRIRIYDFSIGSVYNLLKKNYYCKGAGAKRARTGGARPV